MSASATIDRNDLMTLSGGEVIAEMLERASVGPMFGMGGFQLLPFYDAVRRKGLTHFLTNDERCGAFATVAWARISGRPGVCDATLGPGATNLTTPLVESLNAGIAQVVFIGDTHRDHSWKNMTQEARQIEILQPAAKEVIRIERAARIPELVRRAFAVATSGRPGPVVVAVPEDIAHEAVEIPASDLWIEESTTRFPSRRFRPDPAEVERAAALLAAARRPMILAGGGVHLSRAYQALQALAEALDAPIAHTLSGKGAIACAHPHSAGLFGRYSRIANDLIERADCLLVVDCKLGEIATRRFQLLDGTAPLIHLDIMAEEIGRTTRADVGLVGDAGLGLADLAVALRGARAPEGRREQRDEIAPRMARWRNEASDRLRSTERPINMARIMTELNDVMPSESALVVDGGFAAHWGGLLYDTKSAGRRFVADRGFASIGYGLPGAIGAQLALPDAPVVAVTGDGGFNMTIGELETALRAKTPVTIVVVNNAASGYVKALQHALFGGGYQSSDLVEMNYARVAEEFGCHGVRVEDPDALNAALRSAMAIRDRPSVVDVVVTRDPAKMLPGVDNRTLQVAKGDRPA